MNWLRFIGFQLMAFALMVIGWVLLLPLAAGRCWYYDVGRYPEKHATIPKWNWAWVDAVWGNAEDGVIGDDFYQERFKDQRVCAYLWSAWRNSTNNLRWIGARMGGPFYRYIGTHWIFQAGYRPDNGWPVLRLLRRP